VWFGCSSHKQDEIAGGVTIGVVTGSDMNRAQMMLSTETTQLPNPIVAIMGKVGLITRRYGIYHSQYMVVGKKSYNKDTFLRSQTRSSWHVSKSGSRSYLRLCWRYTNKVLNW
jgi:hypothetical protein